MAEKVILEIDVEGLANKVLEAKANVDAYKQSVAQLTETYSENSKEVVIAEAQLQSAVKAQKLLEGQLLRTTQAEQALNEQSQKLSASTERLIMHYDESTKSLDQNRKVNNMLYAEYSKLDKVGRERLAPTIARINEYIKGQELAAGRAQRNVGNYFKEVATGIPLLGSLSSTVSGSVSAFRAAEGGVKGFGAALATTGLPLIIMGVNTLIDAFRTFEPIADAVNDIMAGISSSFGSSYESGVKLSQLRRKIEDDNRAALVSNAKLSKEISENEAKAENKALSPDKRREFLVEANRLREVQLKQQLELTDQQISAAKLDKEHDEDKAKRLAFLAQYGIGTGEIKAKGETLDKLAELDAKRIDLEKAQDEQKIANQNKIDQFDKQIKEDELGRIKTHNEKKKELQDNAAREAIAREVLLQKNADLQQKFSNENLQDELAKRVEAFDMAFKAEEQAYIAAGKSEIEVTELRNKKILEIIKKFNDEKIKDVEATNRTIQEKEAKAQDDLLNQAVKSYQAQVDNVTTVVNAALEFVQGAIDSISQSVLANQQTELDYEAASIEEKKKLYQSLNEDKLISDKAYQQQIDILDENFRKKQSEQNKKAWETNKALAIVNTVINTAQAIMAQLSNPTPYVGIALAALAAVTGAIQVGVIAAQKPPKFARGGEVFDVGGKSHSDGGTLYTGEDGNRFEVEKGEKIFVLKKTASRHIDALGGLNVAFGGKSWRSSPVSYAADGGRIMDGGFAIRETSREANGTAQMATLIKQIAGSLPSPVVRVSEFEKVQRAKNNSVEVSEL